MWVDEGTGNANYVYFQQLVYSVFSGLIILDFLGASVSRLKALTLTEKMQQSDEDDVKHKAD